jgi:hypothetical protein
LGMRNSETRHLPAVPLPFWATAGHLFSEIGGVMGKAKGERQKDKGQR